MAEICRYLEVSGEGPGFLLPVFREYKGANVEEIQIIDKSNMVVGFTAIYAKPDMRLQASERIEVSKGDVSYWAFRDESGKIHGGSAIFMADRIESMLMGRQLSKFPLTEFEMVSFIKKEEDYPDILKNAFRFIAKRSSRSAENWRDSNLLLPAIKRDILSSSFLIDVSGLDEIFAYTSAGVTKIYLPITIQQADLELHTFLKIASLFDIKDFTIVDPATLKTALAAKAVSWIVVGRGGNAKYVLNELVSKELIRLDDRSFVARGSTVYPGQNKSIFDEGAASIKDRRFNVPTDIFAAIMPSNLEDASTMMGAASSLAQGNFIKHVINVRPLGFGTESSRKLRPIEIADFMKGFDFIWLIANHRQRQTGGYANNLSATKEASRICRAAIRGIIDLHNPSSKPILQGLSSKPSFCLVGSVALDRSLGPKSLCKRLLYSMICQEAALESAVSIIFVWPTVLYQPTDLSLIQVGHKTYRCSFARYPSATSHNSVISLALDVRLSSASSDSFSDFVRSLVSAYGWLRQEHFDPYIYERDGEQMHILTSYSSKELDLAIKWVEHAYRMKQDPRAFLIIHQKSIPKRLEERAEAQGISLIHFSELPRWMRQMQNIELYNAF